MEGTMTGITPTYDLAERNCGVYGYDGFGGGSGMWLFALLILFGLGGTGFGNRAFADGRCATVEDLNNSANFTRLESQVQGIGSEIASGFRNVDNAVCQLGYQSLDHYSKLSKEMSDCCCGINRNIDAVRYENAMNTASVNANTTAQTQKILDAISQNKIESLQARINQLELAQATCGVVRYPTQATYATYGNPFCGCNNGCGY